ncbi:hypothetical protein F4Z99_12680 [Candidatus Poribacteria bacterium]|nr:hypothetical protein [Candidatus Poribacteria bacterium]
MFTSEHIFLVSLLFAGWCLHHISSYKPIDT